MFHQAKIKIDSKSKKEVLEAIGKNTEYFRFNMTTLKQKWMAEVQRIGDCHEIRLMGKILFSELSPLNASIISDNLEFFKNHYKKSNEIDERILQIACLCGAEKIANFLLENCDSPLERYNFILTYVSSSPNEHWAEQIACEMRKNDMEMPKGVSLFCSDAEKMNSIINIFTIPRQGNSPKVS